MGHIKPDLAHILGKFIVSGASMGHVGWMPCAQELAAMHGVFMQEPTRGAMPAGALLHSHQLVPLLECPWVLSDRAPELEGGS